MSTSSIEALASAWAKIVEEVAFPPDYDGTATFLSRGQDRTARHAVSFLKKSVCDKPAQSLGVVREISGASQKTEKS
jgi:hypothetical protein